MKTTAVRIGKELETGLDLVMREEHVAKSEALRKVLEIGITDWRKRRALTLLRKGKVTLWKAAELARLSISEMLDAARKEGVSLPVSGRDVIEDIRAAKK